MVHTIAWRVGSDEALDFWEQRLEGEAASVERSDDSLVFEDPEGVRHELRVVETDRTSRSWRGTPRSRRSTRCRASTACAPTRSIPSAARALLEDTLGFRAAGRRHAWEARGDKRGGLYAYDAAPEGRGIPGAGTVHHVAWATTMDEHEAWQQRVAEAGHRPTPVIDRFYFKSVYFREPNGILFELATLGPGFATDEDPEHLGERLSLPPDFEHLREQIEPRADAAAEPARMTLEVLERPAAGEPAGTLVLLHGRGADEHDLYPLLDALDPQRRLRGSRHAAPLALPPGGRALVPARRHSDARARDVLAELHGARRAPRRPPAAARARRLLAGGGDELRARSGPRPGEAAGGDMPLSGFIPDGRRARARPHRPGRLSGSDRPRHARPGDPGRLQPRCPRRRSRPRARTSPTTSRRSATRSTRRSSRRCAASSRPRPDSRKYASGYTWRAMVHPRQAS